VNSATIVIRDIHRCGGGLTAPEAVARLRAGGQVTVTVTDPAPPEGDPRDNPRHGFDITVEPAPGLPPEISWEAHACEAPGRAALFAEALTLASRLAASAAPGGHPACHGVGPAMQDARDEVRARPGRREPPPAAASGAREAPWPARGGARLYRVVQYFDSWPFDSDSRVRRDGKSGRRTDTFRTLGPVRQRLARANGYARHLREGGGDWSAFVAIAEQLTGDGWQPVEVDLQEPATGKQMTSRAGKRRPSHRTDHGRPGKQRG
jgi:hypothetical protein